MKLLPFMHWLPDVNRGALRLDFMAVLTGAVIVLPQGVVFASIAGMPSEYGLYAGGSSDRGGPVWLFPTSGVRFHHSGLSCPALLLKRIGGTR